jgi:alpha-glucosidase
LAEHDLLTVGETPFTHDIDQLAPYVLPASKELNMVFQFELMYIDAPHSGGTDGQVFKYESLVWKQWSMNEMKTIVEKWQGYKRDEGFWNAYDWPLCTSIWVVG